MSNRTTPRERFGQLLRALREDRGFSMGELARAMDVAVPYLSKVKRGKSPPLTDARITQAADLMGLGRSRNDLRKAAALARVKLTLSPPPTNAHAEFFAKLADRWEELDADALHSMIEIMRGQERCPQDEVFPDVKTWDQHWDECGRGPKRGAE